MLADDEAPGKEATEGIGGAGVVTVDEASHDEDRLTKNDVEGDSAIAFGTPQAALDKVVRDEGTIEPTDASQRRRMKDEEEIQQSASSFTKPSDSLDVYKNKGDPALPHTSAPHIGTSAQPRSVSLGMDTPGVTFTQPALGPTSTLPGLQTDTVTPPANADRLTALTGISRSST
jgi:hypothetical protein